MTRRVGVAGPDWEPSSWLRSKLAGRLEAGVQTLGEAPEPGSRDDRRCDRCDVYVPPRLDYTSAVIRERDAFVVVGLCAACSTAEGWWAA